MTNIVRALTITLCMSLLWAYSGLIQTATGETFSNTVTVAPVAYVYVQTTHGVNLYYAAANAKLTLVAGSPFQTVGEMIGSNGKYFITLGTYWVHVYPVESNGAIGKQVSTINTQNYAGSDCGSTSGAVLDHTGQSLYVLHFNAEGSDGDGICTAYQTFTITNQSGGLVFIGAVVEDTSSTGPESQLAFTGTDKFAYAINDFDEPADGFFYTGISGFSRVSKGDLTSESVRWNPPTPPVQNENLWVDFPTQAATDSTDHIAIAFYPVWDPPKGASGPTKIGSFTTDSAGNLTTTNTWNDMPTPSITPVKMRMSPSGNLLAVAGGGLEIFHFNGALPITPYKVIQDYSGNGPIQWDKANHLFAMSTSALHVYTITPSTVTESAGSPLTISGLVTNSLVVVPR